MPSSIGSVRTVLPRRWFFALSLALFTSIGYTAESGDDAPQPTPASVYAREIGTARFERSSIKVEQGYTVESGNLYARDGSTGSLVVVRSPDGAVIALVNESGKRGLLKIDPQGVRLFKTEPSHDYLKLDMIESPESVPSVAEGTASVHAPKYVDVLMAYNAGALREIESDPVAYSILQLETVNLGLRNSLVSDLSLRLAAVNVFDVDYDTSGSGLAAWQALLANYRALYRADVNAAFTSDTEFGVVGMAFVRGYTSVNWSSGFGSFRHEVGHNAGGVHCNDNPSKYNFGYSNGKSSTYMCGNESPYYSTPAVKDAHGLPLGNAQTADMARVWRENTTRLTGYNPETPGLRMLVVSGLSNQASTYIRIPGIERLYQGGIVALSADVGPTELMPGTDEKFTMLRVKLLNAAGHETVVKLRGLRVQEEGGWREHMNSKRFLGALGPLQGLEIQYDVRDNVALPAGYYNGLLQLEARRANSDWKTPVNIVVSVKK